jgi:hypothetical protein
MAEKKESGIGFALYVLSAVVMSIYFMIQGIHEHGVLMAVCIFPWYMFKGVIWPAVIFVFR